MKSIKFSSSFKKLRSRVSSLLRPFYSFRSDQLEMNKALRRFIVKNSLDISTLESLLDVHKSSINFLYERNEFLSNRVRFLQNALIVISSVLVGVIFYLFSIFKL